MRPLLPSRRPFLFYLFLSQVAYRILASLAWMNPLGMYLESQPCLDVGITYHSQLMVTEILTIAHSQCRLLRRQLLWKLLKHRRVRNSQQKMQRRLDKLLINKNICAFVVPFKHGLTYAMEFRVTVSPSSCSLRHPAQPRAGLDRPSNFHGCTPARYKISPGLRPGKILRILAVAGAPPARVCRLPGWH